LKGNKKEILRIDFHTHQTINDSDLSLYNVHCADMFSSDKICSVGLHPWYLNSDSLRLEKQWMQDIVQRDNVLAIGECGLDKHCKVDWVLQWETCKWQLELAENIKKPVIVHCVRAQQEIIRLLNDFDVEFVFHGFNRSLAMAEEIVKMGGYLSMTATFLRSDNGRSIAQNIEQNSIFLETDNDLSSISEAYICLANIWQKSMDEVEEIIAQNTKRIGLKMF
jgi:TatD DNase family protein